MALFFKHWLSKNKTATSSAKHPISETALTTQEALKMACQSLDRFYREEQAAVLAKIKMLQLIQSAKPIPAQYEQAWATIQTRTTSSHQSIAELCIELQLLLSGKHSELW